MPVAPDPRQYKPNAGTGGKKSGGKKAAPANTGGVDQYVDPLAAGLPSYDDLGLTDTSKFTKNLAAIAAQTANIKPPNYAAYHPQASNWAGQDIRAQVTPLQNQYQDILRTGREHQGLINQAAVGAAALTAPWANDIRDTYMGMGNQAIQLAQGLSGATREAALADAQQFQNTMQGIGSPQTIDPGRAQALSNALTGLGGLSGATLATQAAAAQQGAFGVPQSILGYGQAQGAATLGVSMKEAASLLPQIAAIRAQRGKLTREYQQDLFKTAQTSQDLKLKALGMRADIVTSMGSLANASNTQKIQFAQFQQQTVESHNAIVTANRNYALQTRQIDQAWKIAVMQDANSDADRRQQLSIATADRNAQVSIAKANRDATTEAANKQLEVSWANVKGWYEDSKGNPVAMPGFHIVRGKNGQISAVPDPTPAEKAQIAANATDKDNLRGWTMFHGKPVALPGNKLVYDKGGKFTGRVIRDVTQYSTGAAGGGISIKNQAALMTGLNTKLEDWVFGKPPDPSDLQTGRGGGKSIPGIDPRTGKLKGEPGTPERAAAVKLYQAAGGTAAMPYKDILFRLYTEGGGVLTLAQAKAMVDKYFYDAGENPTYAANNNLALGEQKAGAISSAVGPLGPR